MRSLIIVIPSLMVAGCGAVSVIETFEPGDVEIAQPAGCANCSRERDAGPGPAPRADTIGLVAQNHLAQLYAVSAPVAPAQFQFGQEHTAFQSMGFVAGDWDGDGADSLGIFDSRTAEFQLKNANSFGGPDLVFAFAALGRAVAGDFDGDKRDSIGTYWGGTFFLRNSNSSGPADLTFAFGGGANGYPLIGDWNGDGVDTVGFFDSSTGVVQLRNSNSAGPPDVTFTLHGGQLVPIAGDFDGDGDDTLGLFDLATDTFELYAQNASGPPSVTVQLPPVAFPRTPVAGRWATSPPPPVLGYAFPTGTPASQNIDEAMLDVAYQKLAALAPSHSLLVLRNGVLVREQYFHGGHRNLMGNVKSVSKSVLSALVQIAIDQGKLRRSDTLDLLLPEYFDGNTNPAKKLINLKSMLNMTAGLQWNDQADLGPMIGSAEWAKFVFDKNVVARPGAQFVYSTGLTHLTAVALAKKVPALDAWAETNLFAPAGIATHRWDVDPLLRRFGGAETFFNARDLARFGELYRNNGQLGGKQIISANAVLDATDGPGYDSYWWFMTVRGHPVFYAVGHGGQLVFGARDLQLVVVATSHPNVSYADSQSQISAIKNIFSNDIVPAVRP